ncbi:Uncharacterised protein [Salmonella enterica subsp. enterica serovar Typhimurium str. DT104]|nr:Uncharacterised protein [Salmonella enterica subsp. enterica serovar Typhimurium str. DT104]
MATAKLAADGIPHQFKNFDTFNMVHSVRAAYVFRQVLVDLRIIQIAGAGRQVNQAAGNVTFNNIFNFRVGHWGHHTIGLQRGVVR